MLFSDLPSGTTWKGRSVARDARSRYNVMSYFASRTETVVCKEWLKISVFAHSFHFVQPIVPIIWKHTAHTRWGILKQSCSWQPPNPR